MSRWMQFFLLVLLACVILASVLLGVLYRAVKHVPEFYESAVVVDRVVQKKASARVVQQATTLNSDVRHAGRWQSAFTADDINAWLAVELPRDHAGALPSGFHDPRVDIEPDGITLACRAERGGVSSVLSLKVDVYMESPDVVALRIYGVRVGSVPWRMDRVLEAVTQAAHNAELPIRWRQTNGDPVAFVTLRPLDHGRKVRIDKIELAKGRISIAGTTERGKKAAAK